MLFEDAKEIYIESEQKLLSVFNPDRKYETDFYTKLIQDVLAPLRVMFFATSSTNSVVFVLRFVVYLAISFIVYSLILYIFRGVVSDLFLFFSYPLTLFIASLFSIIAPPSDASFFKTQNYQIEDVIEVIKRKRRRANYAMNEYLNGLKENFQIIEKYAARRNLLLKSLLAVVYLAGAYFVSTAAKASSDGSAFLLFSLMCFFVFFLAVESHTIFKDKVFAVLYSALAELKLEIEEKPYRENNYFISSKEMD